MDERLADRLDSLELKLGCILGLLATAVRRVVEIQKALGIEGQDPPENDDEKPS